MKIRIAIPAMLGILYLLGSCQKSAEDYYKAGNAKKSRGDLDGAMIAYNKAIETDPKYGDAYLGRALLKKNIKDAIEDYKLAEKFGSVKLAGGLVHLGLEKVKNNDFKGALSDYNDAIRIAPKLIAAYFDRGILEARMGNTKEALADFDEIIRLDPKDPKAYVGRGITKKNNGDSDGAMADYNKAIEIDPKCAAAYRSRGSIKKDRDDLSEAITDYDKAIQIDPKSSDAYIDRGFAKKIQGDLKGALADYDISVDLNPNHPKVYKSRAILRQISGDTAGAVADYNRAIELNSGDADYLHFFIWLIQTRQNQKEEADSQLNNYLKIRLVASGAIWSQEIGNFLLGKISETEFLAAANSSDPKKDTSQHCEAWYYAGMKHLLAEDKAIAADYFRKCLNTGEKNFCEYEFAQAELKKL